MIKFEPEPAKMATKIVASTLAFLIFVAGLAQLCATYPWVGLYVAVPLTVSCLIVVFWFVAYSIAKIK